MYNYCKWVWFSARRELQLVLQEDLDAAVTLSAFAASSPRGSAHVSHRGMLCLSVTSYGALRLESFFLLLKLSHFAFELNIL